ncbi:MAG: glycosyltransferase family 2 protein [Actinomycetota bacterium]|nr:glycosyltransferase family 2 protein [Actinomycetota bacterium]
MNFLLNNILFRKISNYALTEKIKKSPPLVSILIPARNEEFNIKRCIKSLLKQDYTNIEILVLDDGSTDDTPFIVKELEKKDSRVKLFTGKPLKEGWLGKSYACWQLSKHAKGEYLVFTDADTLHFKNSISNLIGTLTRNKLDVLSAIPRQIMVSLHERMVITWVHFGIMVLLPLVLVKKLKHPLFSTANGQCMLFKSEVYKKIGGHKSIKTKILEDIHISKQVKRCGFKIMIFDASRSIHCRMYRNFSHLIKGFSKFMFAAFDYHVLTITVVISIITALFLLPFIFLLIGILLFNWSYATINLLIIQIFMILIMRIIMTIRLRGRVADTFLHPLSMIYIILICINSVFQAKFGEGVSWKDRRYDVSQRNCLNLMGSDEHRRNIIKH